MKPRSARYQQMILANAKKQAKRQARVRGSKKDPLRADPTRTATLRRKMLKELRQRFAKLRIRLRKLVIDEDVFGLTPPTRDHSTDMQYDLNAFCPTGQGGGVDASCPPHPASASQHPDNSPNPSTEEDIEKKANPSRISSFIGKVANAAAKLKEMYHKTALRLNVPGLAPDLLDTVEDCQRIFYASGKAVPHPFGGPFSAGQICAVGSHVLAFAFIKAKKWLKGSTPATNAVVDVSDHDLIELIHGIWTDMAESMPEIGRIPSRQWVERYVTQKRRVDNWLATNSEGQKRDEHGRFAKEDIKAASPASSQEAPAKGLVGRLKEKLGKQYERLPSWLKVSVKLAGKAAYAVQLGTQAAAKAVAKEKGLDDSNLGKLHATLMAVDVALGGSRSAGAIAAIGLPHLAAPAAFVPWGSLGYLAYSAVRNPMATLRAAGKAVKHHYKKLTDSRYVGEGVFRSRSPVTTNSLTVNDQKEVAARLADAFADHDWDDWYAALLHCALDEGMELDDALEAADELWQDSDPPDEDDDEVDLEDVFRKPVANASVVELPSYDFLKERGGWGDHLDTAFDVGAVGNLLFNSYEVNASKLKRPGEMLQELLDSFDEESKEGLVVLVNDVLQLVIVDRMDWYEGKGKPDDPATQVVELAQELYGFDQVEQMNEGGRPRGNGWATLNAKHSYSSTQFNLIDCGYVRTQGSPLPILKRMIAGIEEDDLAEGGREETPHVTVKYGLLTKDADEVREIVEGLGPVHIALGRTSLFESPEHDVVKVDAEGDNLRRLNALISDSLEHQDKHDQYQPHVTLAYVKPGRGQRYVDMADVDGMEVFCSTLIFSAHDGKVTKIKLTRPPSLSQEETAAVGNEDWSARRSHEKVEQFQEWLEEQFGDLLVGTDMEQLWHLYAEEGFRKGAGRAFDDVHASERVLAGRDQRSLDQYLGGRDQFLRSSFGSPVAVEKIKLLAGRSFDDLEGIGDDVSLRMSRALTDGLVRGMSPHEVARLLDDELELGRDRTETIARTEIVRAHADGQVHALRDMGVEEVGVQVEWSATEDDRLCPKCAAMRGKVLKLDEAEGMIPLHPNCRCAFIPWLPEDGEQPTKNRLTFNSIKPMRTRRQIIWGIYADLTANDVRKGVNDLDEFLTNCGGPGSGVPGPCAIDQPSTPGNKSKSSKEEMTLPAISHLKPEEVRAAKAAGHLTSGTDLITKTHAKLIRDVISGKKGAPEKLKTLKDAKTESGRGNAGVASQTVKSANVPSDKGVASQASAESPPPAPSSPSSSGPFKPGQTVSRQAIKDRLAKVPESEHGREIGKILAEASVVREQQPAHGMSKPEKVHSIDLDGVKVHVGEGVFGAKHAIGEMLHVPDKLFRALGEVVFTSQLDKHHATREMLMGQGGKTVATAGDGKMVVHSAVDLDRGFIAHEAAHNLAKATWGKHAPPPSSDYGKAQELTGPVSRYAGHGPEEDFAEAVRIYCNPKLRPMLKEEHPAKHAAVAKILEEM